MSHRSTREHLDAGRFFNSTAVYVDDLKDRQERLEQISDELSTMLESSTLTTEERLNLQGDLHTVSRRLRDVRARIAEYEEAESGDVGS